MSGFHLIQILVVAGFLLGFIYGLEHIPEGNWEVSKNAALILSGAAAFLGILIFLLSLLRGESAALVDLP